MTYQRLIHSAFTFGQAVEMFRVPEKDLSRLYGRAKFDLLRLRVLARSGS